MVYKQRLRVIEQEIEQAGVEVALLTSPLSVAYVSGFVCDPHERFMGLVIRPGAEPVLFVPSLEKDKAEAELAAYGGFIRDVIAVRDTDNPYARLLEAGLGTGVKRLAIEKSYMRVREAERLAVALPGVQFADIGDAIVRLRLRKSEEELARMEIAMRLVEEVLAEGLQKVRPGVTELELVAELEYIMKKKGADAPSFDTMVLAGANSALPHGVPGMTKVQGGQFLLFDLGVFKDGYCSDITRTFVVGEPTEEMERIYHTVLAGEEAAIRAVQPGRALAEVDRAARNIITDAGYGHYFTHRVGHGLGLEVHEAPSVHGENQTLMEAGMTFTIEPGIYVPGLGGVRIEDDILVTESGVRVLTAFPKGLTKLSL
ncbi:Xaa-Pro dipeptidase [Aneurinibacillus soli]|uniref:Putative peptidase n=1 Tax=Aneurinibacillus soli TaxID=1500254 RepID=A0A0U5AYT8_9BACL|nr:Xaa-Pro peptidase family protein [Aneurinibacillus soli]PYE62606.1 Xaa-Pro dipeptidase [Aneurinibacillus soli]BAU27168.1 putative peptidase [Aneurinibacillus soli]